MDLPPTETGSQIITLFACLSPALLASVAVADTSQDHQSAAYKRFRGSKLRFESWNEFETDIRSLKSPVSTSRRA